MPAHDIAASLADLPELVVTPTTTDKEAGAAMRQLASFNQCMVGVMRFSGQTPWERHPDDELLYVVEGEVDVTILDARGKASETRVRAGSICVVPAGCWHRQMPRPSVALLFLTSQQGNDVSWAETPDLAT